MTTVAENLISEERVTQQTQTANIFSSTAAAWTIWGCAALFYLYEYVLRVSPSVMTQELMRDFGVTSTALGVLASFYYYAYVPLQIPCGVIVDWLGARRVVTFSALLCAAGSYIFAESDNLFIAQIARFMIGAGSACAYISCMKVTADWFSPQKFALISGITMMMGTIGGTFGGRPFAILVNSMGWRSAMTLAAAVGVVIMVASFLIIRDRRRDKTETTTTGNNGLLDGLKVIASNPQSWLIGIYGGLMYVPLSAFAELWGVPYLMKIHHINNEDASLASAMIFIGMALGCPFGAALSNKLRSRLKVMSWSALSTLLFFSIVIYTPNLPLSLTFGLLLLAGVLCGGQILYFAAAKEINPPAYSATTIGFTNSLVMVSGVIFQPLLGKILDLAWDGVTAADGTPIYSIHDYQQALTTVPCCLLVAWIVLKFVKETYPESTDNELLSSNK